MCSDNSIPTQPLISAAKGLLQKSTLHQQLLRVIAIDSLDNLPHFPVQQIQLFQ